MTRALTLHQPWASLVALGVKTIETRSWAPPASAIGERLLIHAGLAWSGDLIGGNRVLGMSSTQPRPYQAVDIGLSSGPVLRQWSEAESRFIDLPLPLGAIVASCTLAAAVPMVGPDDIGSEPHLLVGASPYGDSYLGLWRPDHREDPSDVSDQRPYGDFAPGRFAWLLSDVEPTRARCPDCFGRRYFDDGPFHWDCFTCAGEGVCAPVPARGLQRIWHWEAPA